MVCEDIPKWSKFSCPSDLVSTYPATAGPPTEVLASLGASNSVRVQWEPGEPSECQFESWRVLARSVDTANGIFEAPSSGSCVNPTNRSITFCDFEGLSCNAAYVFAVQEVCYGLSGSSALSNHSNEITIPDSSKCNKRAAAPTFVMATVLSTSTVVVEWSHNGVFRDCSFSRWAISTGNLEEGSHCTGVENVESRRCIIDGLRSNAEYKFRVRVHCINVDMSSPWSPLSEPVITQPITAMSPSMMSPTPLSNASVLLTWTSPLDSLGDCPFTRWEVLGRQLTLQNWTQVEGCGNLTSKCSTSCTALGLNDDTQYIFKVRAICYDIGVDSPFSEETLPVTTSPRKARAPSNLAAVVVKPSEILLRWQHSSLERCTGPKYQALAKIADSDWFDPGECDSNGQSSNCKVAGLKCGVTYTLKIRVECENPLANSDYSAEVKATTTQGRGQSCLRPALAPMIVAVEVVGPTAISVTYADVDLGDCIPLGIGVYFRSMIESAFTVHTACWTANATQDSCLIEGLRSNEGYSFKVRQLCSNQEASSQFSAPTEIIKTEPIPATPATRLDIVHRSVNSLSLEWLTSELNDCYTPAWEVGIRNESGPWEPAVGCDLVDQESTCARGCTARELKPATQYEFRVRTLCFNTEANSTWSVTVAARTRPIAAPRPSLRVEQEGVTEVGTGAGRLLTDSPSLPTHIISCKVHITWSRSTTGSCPSSINGEDGHLVWAVEARLVHDNTEAAGPWFIPSGCYSSSNLSCELHMMCSRGQAWTLEASCALGTFLYQVSQAIFNATRSTSFGSRNCVKTPRLTRSGALQQSPPELKEVARAS